MSDRTLRRIIARGKERPAGGQSPAYMWLRKHHAALSEALRTDPPTWADTAELMSRAGIVGGKSRPLTDRAVKRIWQRLCQDLAEAERTARVGLAPRSLMPSASPRARTPIEYTRSSSSAAPMTNTPSAIPLPSTSPGTPTGAGGSVSDEEVEARMARLRRTLEERSGR